MVSYLVGLVVGWIPALLAMLWMNPPLLGRVRKTCAVVSDALALALALAGVELVAVEISCATLTSAGYSALSMRKHRPYRLKLRIPACVDGVGVVSLPTQPGLASCLRLAGR